MKIIGRFSHVLVAAALLGIVVLGQAQSATAADRTVPRATSSDSLKASHIAANRVEERIRDLRHKLRITAAQSEQWNAVASVMRENAKTIRDMLVAKSRNASTRSAVDDLQSYQEVAQAHVDGLARLIPVFQALYATMSDDQKNTANALFGRHPHQKMH